MTTPGQLKWRLRFEQLALDANGDRLGPAWEELFTYSARLQYLHGTEAVMAARLEGVSSVIITVRATTASRALTSACRAVDIHTLQVFNLKSPEPTEDRAWLDIPASTKGGGTVG